MKHSFFHSFTLSLFHSFILSLFMSSVVLGMASCGDGNDPAGNVVPEGAIPGKFSVGDNKQVYFSRGNLQATYNGSAWSWRFAPNQWTFIGDAVANNAISGNAEVSENGTVDLFGWSTIKNYYGINNSTNDNDYFGEIKNWGVIMGDGWRTLSTEEWTYLFDTRTGDKASTIDKITDVKITDVRFAKATVNDITGVILFPDGGTFKETDFTNVFSINTANAAYVSTTCSRAQWAILEARGCVFLPAAGYRVGTIVYNISTSGKYWSSDEGASPCHLAFNSSGVYKQTHNPRYTGLSVRLVRDVK